MLESFPGFDTFTGSERFLLANLRLGGVGTISAMANVIPEKIRYLFEHWLAENAEQIQEDLDRYRAVTSDYAAIPALKQIMAARTGDDSWLNLRPPLGQLDAEAGTGAIGRVVGASETWPARVKNRSSRVGMKNAQARTEAQREGVSYVPFYCAVRIFPSLQGRGAPLRSPATGR